MFEQADSKRYRQAREHAHRSRRNRRTAEAEPKYSFGEKKCYVVCDLTSSIIPNILTIKDAHNDTVTPCLNHLHTCLKVYANHSMRFSILSLLI